MFIVSFYIVLIGLVFGFYKLFGFTLESFNHPLFYLAMIAIIIVSIIMSVFIILSLLRFIGIFRTKVPTDNKLNHRFANAILLLASHLLRIKVVATGKENLPKDNFVLMGNHQENYDIIMVKPLLRDYPINFIAKESLFKVPFIGIWMYNIGCIPISKYADRSAAESIIKGIRSVKKGTPIGIFPEGKRSFSNEMLEFKPGAFKLAMKSKTDILVCTFYNAAKIKFGFRLKRQKAYVHFNGLLKYEDYKELKSQELSEKVKSIIQQQLDKYEKELG